MKIIYIDSDFRCHLTNNDNEYGEIETDFFDGKVDEYIEGYRFVPVGVTWIREDGEIFEGEMIAPAEEYSLLENAQLKYELQEMDEYRESLEILGVEV